MAGHAQLNFVMTESSKTQIRFTRHNYVKKNADVGLVSLILSVGEMVTDVDTSPVSKCKGFAIFRFVSFFMFVIEELTDNELSTFFLFIGGGFSDFDRPSMFCRTAGGLTDLSRIVTKPINWHVRPTRTQIRLGIRPV